MDTFVRLTCDGSSGSLELEVAIAETFREAFELWKVKQQKYGPKNIAQLGRSGILDRMASDKFQRLKRFIYEQAPDDGDDAEEDAWLDCVNYSGMGLMVYRGQWPGATSDQVTLSQIWLLIRKYLRGVFSND
jgi:hypothetical protein